MGSPTVTEAGIHGASILRTCRTYQPEHFKADERTDVDSFVLAAHWGGDWAWERLSIDGECLLEEQRMVFR